VLFPPLFNQVTDARDQNKITYPLPALAFSALLLFMCHLKARRQIGYLLRTAASKATYQALFGIENCPHGDTLNQAFSRLNPDQFQEIICTMASKLLRKKVLAPYRVLEKYYVIVIDGTGMITYNERHCPHCLTRTSKGKTMYYHPVLEAKLVTANGFAFSLMTEFIENEQITPNKQDCELKAFYRLADRLKRRFPQLPILLSLDGLYAGGPTFALCERFQWKYMIVLTDKDLTSVNQEFDALSLLQADKTLTVSTGKARTIKQEYRWVTDIIYEDSHHRDHTLNVVQCRETDTTKGTQTTFKWVTNLPIRANNVVAIATQGGRDRWKIENEGFNAQKKGGYELEHAYSTDTTTCKIFYYMLQIAHCMTQLITKGSLIEKLITTPFGSLKNFAFRLLEAWRNQRISQKDVDDFLSKRFQIRFDSS